MVEPVAPQARRPLDVLFGLLALVPAAGLLISGYLVPTVRTVLAGFTDASLMSREGEPDAAGWSNYSQTFGDFAGSLIGPVIFALAVTAVALVFGGGLAWLAAQAGRFGRWAVRIAFALPMAAMASAATAISWMLAFDEPVRLNPLLIQFAAFFGLAVGVGATAFLLVFRRSARPGDTWRGALLVSGVLAAAVLATALQSFTFPAMFTDPDGERFTSPARLVFDMGFHFARTGTASADAVLLWLPLAALGIAVAAALVMTRARIEPAEPAEQAAASVQADPAALAGPVAPAASATGAWRAVTLVAGGLLLLVALAGMTPWLLSSTSMSTRAMQDGVLPHLVHTWVPPLISTLVGTVAAALAGYGIGALRPLGDRSALLLLPFAPWLFTGVAVLMVDTFAHRAEDGGEFGMLIPPGSLNIPVLFASALLFGGVRWIRALPVVGLAALLTWVVQAQDTLWPMIASLEPDTTPIQILALRTMNEYGGGEDVPLGWVYPLPVFLLVAAAIAVVQTLVLDRLALRTGRRPEDPLR